MSDEISLLDVVKERKGGGRGGDREEIDRSIGWHMLGLQMTCHRTNVP